MALGLIGAPQDAHAEAGDGIKSGNLELNLGVDLFGGVKTHAGYLTDTWWVPGLIWKLFCDRDET